MKTQNIKVEIKATVPLGEYCYYRDIEVHCEMLKESYENIPGLSKSICSFLNNIRLEETLDNEGKALTVFKCPVCLKASEAEERALKELAGGGQ